MRVHGNQNTEMVITADPVIAEDDDTRLRILYL